MQGRAVTSDQHERLLEGLRYGMTRRAAAAYAGFSSATLYRMLANDPDETLVRAIERAEGEAEGAYTKIVADAAPKSWQAAAWWLERRHHQDYAQRARIDVNLEVRKEAERVAAELGLDPEAVLAEVESILR